MTTRYFLHIFSTRLLPDIPMKDHVLGSCYHCLSARCRQHRRGVELRICSEDSYWKLETVSSFILLWGVGTGCVVLNRAPWYIWRWYSFFLSISTTKVRLVYWMAIFTRPPIGGTTAQSVELSPFCRLAPSNGCECNFSQLSSPEFLWSPKHFLQRYP